MNVWEWIGLGSFVIGAIGDVGIKRSRFGAIVSQEGEEVEGGVERVKVLVGRYLHHSYGLKFCVIPAVFEWVIIVTPKF